MPLPVVAEVLEEPLAGDLLALFDDACKARIVESDAMLFSALAFEVETDQFPLNARVAIEERCQSK